MGEGEGGGGQDEDLLGSPSPLSPPTEGRGDFVRLCLFNYGLLSNSNLNFSICTLHFAMIFFYFQTLRATSGQISPQMAQPVQVP